MALTARNLPTGEVAVFDDADRDLYLMEAEMDLSGGADALNQAVSDGRGRKFDQATLKSVSQALSMMVLLDCGGK